MTCIKQFAPNKDHIKGPHHGPTIAVELRRGHVQVLKQSTLEWGQRENQTQDLEQTLVHEKEGWTAWCCPQKREVITPTSLDGYLVGVLRTCQFHLALQNKDTWHRGDGGLIFQNVIPHPLKASNNGEGWWKPNTMATSHVGRCPDAPTITSPCSSRNIRGKNHSDQDRFPYQGSSGKVCPPMEARNASTSTTRNPQLVQGKGFIVRSLMECLLLRGTTDGNDLSVHQGLLNRTPRVTIAHTYGRVRNKGRHDKKKRIPWRLRKTNEDEEELQRPEHGKQRDFKRKKAEIQKW